MTYVFMVNLNTDMAYMMITPYDISEFGTHPVTFQGNPFFGKFLPDCMTSFLISGFAQCYTPFR